MALSTAARNAAANAVVDLIDVGAGTSTVEFGNSDFSTIYLTFSFPATAFGNASGGIATGAGTPYSATGAATGTATHYRVSDKDGTVVDERILSTSVSVTSGQSYSMNSITFTQPGS